VVQVDGNGLTSVTVLAGRLGGAALLGGFAAWEARLAQPLFDPRLLRHPPFAAALLGSLVLGLTVLAVMSYSVAFLQTLGVSAVGAALWTLPWSVASFAVALRARTLARRFSLRSQTVAGLVLCTAGLAAMTGLQAPSRPSHLLVGLLVLGVGTGLLNAALARAAVAVVPPAQASMGAGANTTARYLGAAIGVALLIAVLDAGGTAPAQRAAAMNGALLASALVTATGAIAVAALMRSPAQPDRESIRTVPLPDPGPT